MHQFNGMTDVAFYHLTSTPLDHALPKLLEKSLQAGFRVVMRVSSAEEAERFNSLLWTYNTDSFLPHGTAKDGASEEQPIFITSEDVNPNAATLLMVTNGMQLATAEGYKRVIDIFNGADDAQVQDARARWKHYSGLGYAVSYARQNEAGAWEKQGA